MEKKLFMGIKVLPNDKLLEIYHKLKIIFGIDEIKWVPIQNMHITIKYIGNTPDYKIPEITKIIKEATEHHCPFNFDINGLGTFKKGKQIKVIWMGITNVDNLNAFATSIINKLELIGYQDEIREYKPHLTLGRVKFISDENRIPEIFSNYHEIKIQQVEVEEIVLFESVPQFDGPQYNVIEAFPFFK